MTRHQVRLKVLAREERIRQWQEQGLTCAEIGDRLGVDKQRVYNFLQQCKNRPPIVDRIAAARAEVANDRALKKKKIHVNAGHLQGAADVLTELRDLLDRSAFASVSVRGRRSKVIVVTIGKTKDRPRHHTLLTGSKAVVTNVRRELLASAESILVRRREQSKSGAVRRQVWSFSFVKI